MKVYQMNDYEFWVSPWDKRRTLDYYLEYMEIDEKDNPIESIRECDIDKEGVWFEIEDKADIERLGESDEILHYKKTNQGLIIKPEFGDLMKKNDVMYKYISFREAIEKIGEYNEPYCIVSTY